MNNELLRSPVNLGRWLLVAAAFIGTCVAVFDYFSTGNGIDHTGGALLVVVSTVLILSASLILAFDWKAPRWAVVVLLVLIFLGVICTAIAAYFLEADLLLVSMALALCGWFAGSLVSPRRGRTIRPEIHAEAMR